VVTAGDVFTLEQTTEAPEVTMSEEIGVNLIVENVSTIDLSPVKPNMVKLMENCPSDVEPGVVVPEVMVPAPSSFPVHASSGLVCAHSPAKRGVMGKSGSATPAKSGSATTTKSGSASMKPGSVKVSPRASSKTGPKPSAKQQAKSKAGRK